MIILFKLEEKLFLNQTENGQALINLKLHFQEKLVTTMEIL